MEEILRKWLYHREQEALDLLNARGMADRNNMAAEMQRFADWLALQNSRAPSVRRWTRQ